MKKEKKGGSTIFEGSIKPSEDIILVMERLWVVILKLIQQSDYVLITQNIII